MRLWAECTRMTQEEMEDNIKEARELAEVFAAISSILETMLEGGVADGGT